MFDKLIVLSLTLVMTLTVAISVSTMIKYSHDASRVIASDILTNVKR